MKRTLTTAGLVVSMLGALLGPAAAHHVMDGKLPATFTEGLLSGLGHPVIGLDHLAAVVAVGCLAALHRRGAPAAVGYVLAMIAGVVLHIGGATVPGGELLVGLTVLLLGAVLLWQQPVNAGFLLGLFAVTGVLHGYVMGESIVGAEPAPLAAYLAGLAAIQSLIALVAFKLARFVAAPEARAPLLLRTAGAAVAVVGALGVLQQVLTSA